MTMRNLLLFFLAFINPNTVLGSMRPRPMYNISAINREPFLFDLVDLENSTRRIGYIQDLVDELQKRLKFDYNFLFVPDGHYGIPNDNQNWNGMIGELLLGKADFIAADLTINAARSEVVDFTPPFMQIDWGVVYKKPAVTSNFLAYMMPFSNAVWYTIIGSLLVTSSSLYTFAHFNSQDTRLSSAAACLYFGLACLFAQGPETYPKSIASRMTAISWWFFSLMMLTLYTASMTSMLTVNKSALPIEKIEDLIDYGELHYAIEPGQATQWAFQSTSYEPFRTMWGDMESRDTGLFGPEDGMSRVRSRSDFAFIRESPYIAYDLTFAPCDLEVVYSSQNPNSGSGYGFAFPKGSQIARNFSTAILELIEEGVVAEIHAKWFTTRNQCSEAKKLASNVDEIGIVEIRGIFITFLGGLAIAFLFFVIKIGLNFYDKKCINPPEK
ncbi:glutamate receptor 1-like [Symsagittifera roscoffensis]|uniref:glutamate receptor 1-like n=1 Tax=Symsagittifera roscoffensis TaxID=84072 RepID=UPI00307C6E88